MTTTKAEQRQLNRLAGIGCILCRHLGMGETPAEIHHIRTGASGLHGLGTRGFERRYSLSELDLLFLTIEALNT